MMTEEESASETMGFLPKQEEKWCPTYQFNKSVATL
jgi:hypothetical protein